jgi:hypothetical protein
MLTNPLENLFALTQYNPTVIDKLLGIMIKKLSALV